MSSSLTTRWGTLRLFRGGSGPPLVLLHGLGSDHSSFDAVRPRLEDRFHVVAFDLLGHGESDVRPADLSIRAQAGAVAAALEDLALEPAAFVGHCLGGSVAVMAAAIEPRRPSRLVLIGAGSYEHAFPRAWRFWSAPIPWSILRLCGGQRALRRARERAGSKQREAPRGQAAWAALGRAFRQTTSPMACLEMEECVESRLVHPTLVLWGAADRITPIGPARIVLRDKANVRFLEIPGGSHMLHEESPALVSDLIRDFLE